MPATVASRVADRRLAHPFEYRSGTGRGPFEIRMYRQKARRHGAAPFMSSPSGAMRRLRRLRPGARFSLTFRLEEAVFRLRPDEERTNLFGYWLARACNKYPGIVLVSATQMSGHGHVEVVDRRSELSWFMAYFLKNLSTALNYIDGRRGHSFERRFTAIEIVDDDALVDRAVYTVVNPVEAGLVRSHEEWPGVCVYAGEEPKHHLYRRFRSAAYARAVADSFRTGAEVNEDEYWDEEELVLEPVEGLDVARLENEIANAEAEIRRQRQADGLPWMGAQRVQVVDPFERPDRPKRRRVPLCHATTRAAWLAYRDAWRAFTGSYRAASRALRRGLLFVEFPKFSFRPSIASFQPG